MAKCNTLRDAFVVLTLVVYSLRNGRDYYRAIISDFNICYVLLRLLSQLILVRL